MTWLCAYAITRDRPAGFGVGATHVVGYRGLGLVVAEVDRSRFDALDTEDPVEGALAELAREHDAVVRAVFRLETVLPLRFGTLLEGEEAAIRLLRTGYEEARARLAEVAGHREWGVRVRYAEPVAPRTDPAGLTGTEYLVRRRDRLKAAQRSRADVVRTAARLDEALRRHASAGAERACPHGVLLNTAYLLPEEREAEFHSELEWLARELRNAGASVETTGPWPPYSFADLELAVTADG